MALTDRSTAIRRKTLALAGLVLVLGFTGIANLIPPAPGYEISLYQTYPWYYWVAVIGAVVIGLVLILEGAFDGEVDDRYWQLGMFLVLLTYAFLLFAPYVRGYPVYGRGDVLTHVGYVKSIAQTGSLGSVDIYPNIHLFVYTIAAATGVPVMNVINLLSPLVTLVSLGAFYLLLTKLFDDQRTILFGTAFALLLIGTTAHMNPSPFAQSTLLVPFVLFLFFREQRSNSIAIRIAFVLSIFSMVFYHPLTTVFLLAVFAIYVVVKRLDPSDRWPANPTVAVSITSVVFVTWYYNFAGIIKRFESIFQVFVAESGGSTQLDTYSSTIEQTSPALIDILRIALFRYGISAILLGLATLYAVFALYLYLYRHDRPEWNRFTATVLGSFVFFTVISIAFLVVDFTVTFGRPLIYARLFATVLAGLFFYLLWRTVDDHGVRRGVRVGLYGTLVVLVVLATFSLYYSPLTTQSNMQVTQMELDGTEWLFEHDTESYQIDQFGLSQRRFHDAHYGKRDYSSVIRFEETTPPPHFNYTEHRTLGQSYEENTYLMWTRLGRITYQETFPDYEEHWRYTPEDYDRLEYDPSVNRIYSNGEFDAYLIEASASGDDTS